jgi:hypothetical protein
LRRTLATVLVAVASTLALLVFGAAPAAAGSPCGKKVLKDWSGNSRIDGTYPLHCYQDAIDALPRDLFDYSDAPDVIGRAFLEASGGRKLAISRPKHSGGPPEQLADGSTVSGSSPSSLPFPLLVLTGIAVALLAAGGLGYVSRRRRADE